MKVASWLSYPHQKNRYKEILTTLIPKTIRITFPQLQVAEIGWPTECFTHISFQPQTLCPVCGKYKHALSKWYVGPNQVPNFEMFAWDESESETDTLRINIEIKPRPPTYICPISIALLI